VIIKGLAFQADENDIGNFLESNCGEIASVNLLKGPEGKSKGIAFVKFVSEEGMKKAIAQNGVALMSRNLTIEQTIPKELRQSNVGGASDRKPGVVSDNSTTVFVGNLAFTQTEEELKNFFESCGKVVGTRLAKDKETNRVSWRLFIKFNRVKDSVISSLPIRQVFRRPS